MKIGRRGFLGRLLAGAAAVVGAGALAPSVVRASEGVTVMPGSLTVSDNTIMQPPTNHTALVQGYIDRGEVIPPGTYNISRTLHVGRTVVGSGPDTTILKWTGEDTGSATVLTFDGPSASANGITIDGNHRANGVMVGPPTFEAMQADAYERGRFIAESRAESRVALGLPLSRDADG